jgi:hypothetical protein
MQGRRRTFASVALTGWLTLGLVPPGCGGGLGQVTARQDPSEDRPAVPDMTVERLQECVREYGGQLEPGRYSFSPNVQVSRGGFVQEVSTYDIPQSAPDLAACTRVVLREMALPDAILQAPPSGDAAATTSRAYMGSPAVVVIVVVGLSELVLEAGAYTILFAVTVELVNEAGKDIAEAARRRRTKKDECTDAYVACMDSKVGDELGNTWNESRCGTCRNWCDKNNSWPSQVMMWDGWVPCGRLGPTWKN